MQLSGPATYITLEGGDYLRPPVNSSTAGRFLVDYGPDPEHPSEGRLLDWSTGPALIEPGTPASNNTDYLSPTGWRPVPPSVAPGGSAGQLQYNNGTSFAGMSGSVVSGSDLTLGGNLSVSGALQFNPGTGFFALMGNLVALSTNGMVVMDGSYVPAPVSASQFSTSNTPTSNAPAIYVNQTWNNVAVPFTLMYGNVTDSASASTSNLIDLQVGSTSRFKVDKNATISVGSTTVAGSLSFPGSAYTPIISRSGNGDALTISRPLVVSGGDSSIFGGIYMRTNGRPIQFSSGSALEWSNATDAPLGTVDAKILRNTTGQLDVRADSGLRIRNFANGADGPLTASSGTFSGNVNTDYVGRSSSVEPSIRFTSSQGQFWAAGVNMYYWNNNGWYPTTTGYANLGMLNQAWAALSLERPSWQGNAALLSIRHKSGGDQTHTAITVTDYGLTSYFNVAHNGNITSSGILALTSTTAASNKIQWKDDGAGDWIIASGGVASTDGFRIVKQGVADIIAFRPSIIQAYANIATTGTIQSAVGSVGATGIQIGAANNGFYNSGNNIRVVTNGTVVSGFYASGFESTGFIGLTTGSPGSGISDIHFVRNATGPTLELRAAGGVKIRDHASADAPLTASKGVFSGKAAIGYTTTANAMLYINDMQGSSYPSIHIDKFTWGSPISLSWATESPGITSVGSGPIISHALTMTNTSMSNAFIAGGGIDAQCEYDQPYVTGIRVRGRKTRTDAPTHTNLAYGIYAIANSGKASGLGGAAGYFLCETPNVAGVQIKAAASQSQSLLLVQNSASATLAYIDQTGNIASYGYTGFLAANGGFYGHQDAALALGQRFSIRGGSSDGIARIRTYNNSDYADLEAKAAVFTSTVEQTQSIYSQTAAPTPGTNKAVRWIASGSGVKDGVSYDQGDELITINVGGTSKTKLLADFSAM